MAGPVPVNGTVVGLMPIPAFSNRQPTCDGVRAHVAECQRVAVGIGTCGSRRAGRAARAGDIFHKKLLARCATELVGDDPSSDVGRPARRERHYDRHRTRRITLRLYVR